MLNECFNRHILLKGFLATTAVAALGGSFGAAAEGGSTLTFAELDRVRDAADHWPEGYDRQVLLRWGDAIFPDSPEFDLATIDGPGAEHQFGYNYDFTASCLYRWARLLRIAACSSSATNMLRLS